MKVSTNALIAALRAACHEQSKLEAILQNEQEEDSVLEESGYNLIDLQEALAYLVATYEQRREEDPSLSPASRLLEAFSAELGIKRHD